MKILYRIKQLIIIAGDIVSYTLGLWIAIGLRKLEIPTMEYIQGLLGIFFITFFLWLTINYINGIYDLGTHETRRHFYRRFWESAGMALIVGIVFFYVYPNREITPKTILVLTVLFGYGISALWRLFSASLIAGKHLQSRVLFIGMDDQVKELLHIFERRPQKGYLPVALIEPHVQGDVPTSVEVFKDMNKIRPVISTRDISMVVISTHVKKDEQAIRELYELLFWPVSIHHVPAFYEMITGRISPAAFSESWFLEHLRNKEQPIYTRVRRLIDYVAAFCLAIVFVLLFPFIALSIKATSPGPIFFKQERIGKSGKKFMLYKFRSMYALAKDGSAEPAGYQFAVKNDKRITKIGKFLRKTRLDELPQLVNVIKGDLTLIGPRPERPEVVEQLSEQMPYYPLRHIVAPGLTGWALIHQNYADSLSRSLEKFQYDVFYIKNRSPLLDISIILRTINIIFRGLGQ